MSSDQMIPLLQASVVVLLLTNALSVAAAVYAIAVASGSAKRGRDLPQATAALVGTWPSGIC